MEYNDKILGNIQESMSKGKGIPVYLRADLNGCTFSMDHGYNIVAIIGPDGNYIFNKTGMRGDIYV